MAPALGYFCRVIDNFGDIGVTWRLAGNSPMSMVSRFVWVDDLAVFQMNPALNPDLEIQQLGPIEVRHWKPGCEFVSPADVVIEAFACQLPEKYILAMAAKRPQSVWINPRIPQRGNLGGGAAMVSPPHNYPARPNTFSRFTRATGGC